MTIAPYKILQVDSKHSFYRLPISNSPKFILILGEKHNDYLKIWRGDGFNGKLILSEKIKTTITIALYQYYLNKSE